jgi:hypothetical protein
MKPDIRIDVFKAAHYDQKDTLEPENDTMRYDFTNKFWNGLKDKLDRPFLPVNSVEESVYGKKLVYFILIGMLTVTLVGCITEKELSCIEFESMLDQRCKAYADCTCRVRESSTGNKECRCKCLNYLKQAVEPQDCNNKQGEQK